MKISELVAQLVALKEKHGDVDVYSQADWTFVNDVQFEEMNGKPVVVVMGH